MLDFGQLLREKSDTIIEKWVEAVRSDRQIESASNLPFTAVQDHIPLVLQAMSTMLSQSQDNDIQALVLASWEYGIVRVEQGFTPAEIVREHRLLRCVIFSTLNEGLLKISHQEAIRSIGLIDTVIDEAMARCSESYTELQYQKIEQLQSQLKSTNLELTRLIRANQDNFSHIAHELKTPLTSIIGYSDLFLRSSEHQTEVKETTANLQYIERVLRNGRHLLCLLNDALEISRYDAGKMKRELALTDVRALINNVSEMLSPLAQAKELQLVVDVGKAFPTQIFTDSLRLQQIVTNLVSNAIRYTESGTIKLTCCSLPREEWAIAVCDTGMGIAEADQAQLFDPYFRVGSNNQLHSPDSTGLGLAIVERLVKLLQGKISLVSQAAVGSTFTVTLPLLVKSIEN
jgi:hypothetical protein